MPNRATLRWMGVGVLLAAVIIGASLIYRTTRHTPSRSSSFAINLDPGTPLSGPAPDFTLIDQAGKPVSLHSYRGRVVILAFNDSQCTTVCPLTTTAMVQARQLLGSAGSKVALLGVDANPTAISIADVRAYSEVHRMTDAWRFLTGSLRQLRHVWKAYNIDVAIEKGQIDHTPALFVIDPRGHLAKVYLTQMAYSSIGQQAQLLAQEASNLLPGHPQVQSHLSYTQIPSIAPSQRTYVSEPGGGSVTLGPGAPRLYVFFATWDSEVMDLGRQLRGLDAYQAAAGAQGLPRLTGIDEASVEPSTGALPAFLHHLGAPLSYPIGIDASGRIADGYGVQDEPWFVLVGAHGQILWYYDISTLGWLSTNSLIQHVHAALARSSNATTSLAIADQELAGSPPPLAALHSQASQLLGGKSDLMTRLKALRGYPVVINVWASWCGPCQAEFGLFATASARYGRRVAFLGVDANDAAAQARPFLSQHQVSYPSYQANPSNLTNLAIVQGLPTTIFVRPNGTVAYVHTGQYEVEGTLDEDIANYALRG
jgi:cytochrome oxidase Cu insertion factor (SCO1/SenC/PrrC family)/thiol-disulfide isomerase/thioredoxin